VASIARATGRLGHHAPVLVPSSLVAEIEREGLPYEVVGPAGRSYPLNAGRRARARWRSVA